MYGTLVPLFSHDADGLCVLPQATREEARVAKEAAAEAGSEATALAARLVEVEEEMRQLLMVVEQQKAISASKMKQLASFLQDL